jgi:hypothetical protein
MRNPDLGGCGDTSMRNPDLGRSGCSATKTKTPRTLSGALMVLLEAYRL